MGQGPALVKGTAQAGLAERLTHSLPSGSRGSDGRFALCAQASCASKRRLLVDRLHRTP